MVTPGHPRNGDGETPVISQVIDCTPDVVYLRSHTLRGTMSTNDSHKLRHSAIVKNGSPHMNGGGPHTQIQKRPAVTTNDGLVVKRPVAQQAQGARPVLKVRMENGQPQPEVEIGGAGGRGPATQEGVGLNKFGKRMIMVRMDNGKPKADNGRSPGGKMQRVALPGRKAIKNDPRFANLRAQRDQRQLGAAPAPAPAQVPFASSPSLMSNEQLMLCRYAVKKYAESDSNELTAELCAGTLKTIDTIMAIQQAQPVELEAQAPVEIAVDDMVDPGDGDAEVEIVSDSFEEAPQLGQEPNKLTPDQISELEQFEDARPKPRVQGVIRPFAARQPGRPAPIDTEPGVEPDNSKSE